MNESEPIALQFSLVSRGSGQSQATGQEIDSPSYRVIRSQDSWNAFWNQRPEPRPQEGIDFDKDIVLCVYRGQKPTGGYGISVTAVEWRNDAVTVSLELSDPPAGSMLTQALTSPYAIYRIGIPPGTDLGEQNLTIRFVPAQGAAASETPRTLTLQRLQ
jgi:hypothetical protein